MPTMLENLPSILEIELLIADGAAFSLLFYLSALFGGYLYRRHDFKAGYACAAGAVLLLCGGWVYEVSGMATLLLPVVRVAVAMTKAAVLIFALPVPLLILTFAALRRRPPRV